MDGKVIRLKQLFGKAGQGQRIFILPLDHGVTMGPVQGITDLSALVRQVADKVDGIIVHKGMVSQLKDCINIGKCGLIVHLSASTSLSPDSTRKEIVTSVEQAVKLGATAVSVHINLGSCTEASMLKDMGKVAELCANWGMPLLAMMYVRNGNDQDEYHPEKISHAARVAEELGADIVKVNYTGTKDSFVQVVNSVKIPVIIAGGPKMSSDDEILTMIADSVSAGAKGVAIGRNIFQHRKPDLLADRIRELLDA